MGATSGIGREVSRLLAADGWTVAVAGRRTERLRALVEETDGIVQWAQVDVTRAEAPRQLCALAERLGGMDLYFHSSGIGWNNKALDEEKEVATAETNGTGFVRMVAAAFNYMAVHGGGHIAAISSVAGTKGLGAAPAYSATKAMQQHYLEALAQLATLRRLPVTLTDIRPGFVATDLLAGGDYPLTLRVEDVARAVVSALRKRKSVATIDWRYRLLVALWRMVPRSVWVRMRIG